MISNIQDEEDIYLKIRYNYVVNIKKLESFSKELLKLDYNQQLFKYIRQYIDNLNHDMYSKNNIIKTYEIENVLLSKNMYLNLEILFHAFNKLFSKRLSKKILNNLSFENKKEALTKKICHLKNEKNKKNIRSKYKVLVNSLTTIELILFIEYVVNAIQENIN